MFAKPVDRDYKYHGIVKWKRTIAERVVRFGIEAGSLHMPCRGVSRHAEKTRIDRRAMGKNQASYDWIGANNFADTA